MNKHNIIKVFFVLFIIFRKLFSTYLTKIIFYIKNDLQICRCGFKKLNIIIS